MSTTDRYRLLLEINNAISGAAARRGLKRTTLQGKMKKLGIERKMGS